MVVEALVVKMVMVLIMMMMVMVMMAGKRMDMIVLLGIDLILGF